MSGPSKRIFSRIASAGSETSGRYGFVLGTCAEPGKIGSNGARAAVMPVAVSAPIVVPW